MTVSEALKQTRFELNLVPDRDVDAAWILSAVTGLSRSELTLYGDKVLTEKQQRTLEVIVKRRATREPLQYIFGFVPFWDIALKCDPRALIPRDETALLAEKIVAYSQKNSCKTLLDLCTGSGAIALAVKKHAPFLEITASDISRDALALAKENSEKLSLPVKLMQSDLFSAFEGKQFDVIVSNPPYVATGMLEKLERELAFEPQIALDGGADGADVYRDIIAEAPQHLTPGGLLAFEIGYDQGVLVRNLMERIGFENVMVFKDYSHIDRMVFGQWKK